MKRFLQHKRRIYSLIQMSAYDLRKDHLIANKLGSDKAWGRSSTLDAQSILASQKLLAARVSTHWGLSQGP